MVDVYKVSWEFFLVKLINYFVKWNLTFIAYKKKHEKGGKHLKVKWQFESENNSTNVMAHFVKKMKRRNKHFNKKDVRILFRDLERHQNKSKSNIIFFECNKKWHYKSEWLEKKKTKRKRQEEERAKGDIR